MPKTSDSETLANKRPSITSNTLSQFKKVVHSRRSVRQFTDETIPDDVVNDCLDMALVAPNSSNLQMWNFYRVTTPSKKAKLAEYCMGQQAAKTAAELIVCTGHTKNWRQHTSMMLDYWPQKNIPKVVKDYYTKLTYVSYITPPLDPFGVGGFIKKSVRDVVGLAQPMMRWPNTEDDMKAWASKSVALACENLMLAFRAYDYDTCPMEGFDEARVRKLCQLDDHEFVVMIVAAGRIADKGIYHEQFRFERERFIHEI